MRNKHKILSILRELQSELQKSSNENKNYFAMSFCLNIFLFLLNGGMENTVNGLYNDLGLELKSLERRNE